MAKNSKARNEKDRGQLDLLGVFQAEAIRMNACVKEGRILHKSNNIRDAGAPLEAAVRAFFARRLPEPFRVSHGYLYDPQSNCTPQIDLVVTDANKGSVIFKSDSDVAYMPLTAAHVIGEVKVSSGGMNAHLQQLSDRINAVKKMFNNLQSAYGGGLSRPRLLSFLFLAEANKLADQDLANYLASAVEKPDYVVLLDRAELVATESVFNSFTDAEPRALSFGERGVDFWVFGPSPPNGIANNQTAQRGQLLLWFYYSIVYHLQDLGLNQFSNDVIEMLAATVPNPSINRLKPSVEKLFTEEINRSFPLKRLRKLTPSSKQNHDN